MRKTMATKASAEIPTVKLLYSPREAAVILGMGNSTIYELLLANVIKSCRIGRSRRIHRDELIRFAAEAAGLSTGNGPRAA